VNAPLLARERGIDVAEERRRASHDFTNLVSVRAFSGEGAFTVAGTTLGQEHRPRLVRALGYEIEVELDPLMLLVVNDDRPGMIGRLGTLLGETGVNIANMAVSRNRRGARALMALSVDTRPPDELLERMRGEPGFVDVRFLVLP
jgi:D-3-phosphoglycerate dehydrogenase